MSSNLLNLSAVGIDPDPKRRIRVKQAAQSVTRFKEITLVGEIRQAEELLSGDRSYDVFFLSERLEEESLRSFVKKAKEAEQSRDAAFVLLMSSSDGTGNKAARNLLAGFDGFLMEPYSVDILLEITELAEKIKKERSEAREKAVIGVLLKELTDHVDRIAYIKSCQLDVSSVLERLRKSNSLFASLNEDSLAIYFQSALELFGSESISDFANREQNYKGTSERIKKKMAEKLLAEEIRKIK